MRKVIAFGASNSSSSINKQLATWAANQVESGDVEILDLNDFEMPIYSIDKEKANGIPEEAMSFKRKIREADALIISLAEHNGSYSTAFKNVHDWVSRIEKGTWADTPILLLSTSPGGRGGRGVLDQAVRSFPHQGAQVVASFSLPSFKQNFDKNKGITDPDLASSFDSALAQLKRTLEPEAA